MVSIFLFFISSLWSQETPNRLPDYPFYSTDYNLKVLEHWPYGSGFCVLIDEDIIHYTNGSVLMTGVIDGNGKVEWLSEYILSGIGYTMVKDEEILYVGVDDQGIAVLDISNPGLPILLNQFQTSGRVFGLDVWNDTIYAAMGTAGVEVFDCSKPLQPELLNSISGYNFRDLEISDKTLYASARDYGLIAYNVTDLSDVNEVSRLGLFGQHEGLEVSGNQAWLCSYDGNLNVIDISSTSDPRLDTNLTIFTAWQLDMDSATVCVATHTEKIYFIDRLTFETKDILSFDSIGIWPYEVSLRDGIGSVAGHVGSWWVFDDTGEITDGNRLGGSSQQIAIDNDRILVSLLDRRLMFFKRDLSPRFTLELSDICRDFLISGDTLFIAENWAGLSIHRITDTGDSMEISLISRTEFAGNKARSVEINGGYAYLTCGDSGLIVVDITDPENPERIEQVLFETLAMKAVISGDTLFCAMYNPAIWLVDINDPYNPVKLLRQNTVNSIADLLVHDGMLFTAQGPAGVIVYDISDNFWQTVSIIGTDHITLAVEVFGNTLYTAQSAAGVYVYDVTDLPYPIEIGHLDTGGEARDITVSGDSVFVADGYDGVMKLLYSVSGFKERQQDIGVDVYIWPNPFSSRIHLSRSEHVRMFDASGREVLNTEGNIIDTSSLPSGVFFLDFDGKTIKMVKVSTIN